MPRKAQHSREEMREMALDAAQGIIAEAGIEGLSTRKIAARIGYAVGTLYLAFENLDEVILYLNARTLDSLHQKLSSAVARRGDQPPLFELAHTYYQFSREHSALWHLLYDYRSQTEQEIPHWFTEKVSAILEIVAQAVSDICNRQDKHYHEYSQIFWSQVHGICELQLTERLEVAGNTQAEELINLAVNVFIDGIQEQ